MDIIGTKVKHALWGTGTIISLVNNYMEIEFPIGVKKLVYPDAFEKYIKAEDSDMQAAILQMIKDAKDAEEQRKRDEEAARKAEAERKAAEEAARRAAGGSGTTKKKKTLDEMFAPDYHAEKLARQPILTYQQVEDQFGIRISGFGRGINPTDSTVVLISSIGKASGNFVYHDKWNADGDYLYSGEGKTGDQKMTGGNLAIASAAEERKDIHLFVKFSPMEYYYQGIFDLADYTLEEGKDENGNSRMEYKFRLTPRK